MTPTLASMQHTSLLGIHFSRGYLKAMLKGCAGITEISFKSSNERFHDFLGCLIRCDIDNCSQVFRIALKALFKAVSCSLDKYMHYSARLFHIFALIVPRYPRPGCVSSTTLRDSQRTS